MKNIYCIFFLIYLSNNALAQSDITSFSGTWAVNIEESILLMDESLKLKFDGLNDETKNKATASIESRRFIFSRNFTIGIFWRNSGERRSSKGTWKIDESKKIIVVTIDETPVSFNYDFQSSDVLILRGISNRGFFNNLYLKKK